jgi:hypothetical protein
VRKEGGNLKTGSEDGRNLTILTVPRLAFFEEGLDPTSRSDHRTVKGRPSLLPREVGRSAYWQPRNKRGLGIDKLTP